MGEEEILQWQQKLSEGACAAPFATSPRLTP